LDIFKMLKEVGQMKSKFQDVQKNLKDKEFKSEDSGISITVNGLMEVVDIKISDEALSKGRQYLETSIKKCLSGANRSAKEFMQKEFKASLGGMPGLDGLLGG